ncbi:Planctomycete cytochrome C [Stieleria maiorica]|uniref:Planctomycete cytochrome C n=1 Tax=Stieleria maiorica TaxID=2795974 RepID=A0A5B9MJP9_9BACT|nr:PSD1 and planctomycete cytochrome C domain-containing protein [Stieleria maiorica]QEF99884.1 Planctomycete cytochrome C [Stieleria maiorica]
MKHPSALAAVIAAVACCVTPTSIRADTPATKTPVTETPAIHPDQEAFFESKIRPLLIQHCYECHSRSAGESSGELFVDDAASLRSGGTSGPALVPGDPEASLMIRAVRYDDADYEMPPTGKLDDAEIKLLEDWVRMGAPDPRQSSSPQPKKMSPMEIDPRSHWAFNPPQRFRDSVSPAPEDRDLIDAIAGRAADQAGVSRSPRCDDETLIRRLYHDLTGLPPNIDQISAFASSTQVDKVERLVDRLLASAEYAERFARHWMDVARYADTIGYALAGKERRLEGSERYRDWLIRAFARDVPFDQMVRLQLAADRIDPNNEHGDLDAMGFLTVGRRFLNRYDTIDDRIDVITRGLMGMTVACARCHDHKFDPIPTKDYYSLLGILQSSETPEDGASPLALVDKPKPADSHVFLRGQPGNRGETAPRQYLTALRKPDEPRFNDGSGRRELADRLASPENPLVARVLVNRIWLHLIGRPFVDSTSDFGVRTEAPPLVDVLDELAAEFSEHWSVKRLVRRIVTSRIYAQSAQPADDRSLQADPENRLAARGNRRRRDFESLRDSVLAVCGQLDRTVGGPPVEIHLASPSPRRTLYAMIDRQNLPALFRTFDVASPDAHTPKRFFTTVPQQALFLMNHPQIGVFARSVARQIRHGRQGLDGQVDQMFVRLLSRSPTPIERDTCIAFLQEPAGERPQQFDPRSAWQYGTTPVDTESRVTEFRPLPVFSGSSWQDQEKLPASSEYGYASIGEENGHPGPKHAVVRRWTAPAGGRVSISGMVGHRNDKGDGVQLAIWVGDKRIWREDQKSNNRPFRHLSADVTAGETVDFVVSPRDSDSFDSFFLRCQISLRSDGGEYFEGDSKRDFSGPLEQVNQEPLGRLAQLAQTLLLSNEFMFVD